MAPEELAEAKRHDAKMWQDLIKEFNPWRDTEIVEEADGNWYIRDKKKESKEKER